MRINRKTRDFLLYSLDMLRYKKAVTAVNILCNAVIFSHQAAVNFCVMQALNALQASRGLALGASAPYLAGILIAALIRVAAIMGCGALDAVRSYYYQNRVRANVLRLLLKRGDATWIAGRSGPVFEVLDNDVPISTFPAELLTEVTGHFIYTLIALSMLLYVNWRLTLFIFIPLSAAIYGVQRLSGRMKERRYANRAAHDEASGFIGDISDTVLAIKAAGAEEAALKRYDAINKNRRAAALKDSLFNARLSVLLNGAVYAGAAVMMFAAARLMAGGTFGIGDFSLFIANLGTLADCVNRIVELASESRRAEVSYERILNLAGDDDRKALNADAGVKLRPDPRACSRAYEHKPLKSFEVRDLSFDYGNGHGFYDVSFMVRPGELTVAAGEVGSGKSTLLSVLMGLFPADKGELLLDGAPVNAAVSSPADIAGAPQRGGFFSGSLYENICLGYPAEHTEIERALSVAALDEMAADMINSGAEIGSRGGRLSGGQQQRLALARMLARGARLNVIDDCVSALDEDTRYKVLFGLLEYLRENSRSAVMATNDRVFLEAADQILYMEHGRITGQGQYGRMMEYAPFQKLFRHI